MYGSAWCAWDVSLYTSLKVGGGGGGREETHYTFLLLFLDHLSIR